MAIIVEDGTGLVNSVSYSSVAEADAYFLERGNVSWAAALLTAKEVALVKATDYIDTIFNKRFNGSKNSSAQALEYPRTTDISVPKTLKRATFEYALVALSSDLLPNLTYDTTERAVSSKSVTVGPITTSTTYSDSSKTSSLRKYPNADRYISPLLKSSSGVYR